MWLVLSSSNDASALWAYQGLKSIGLEPLEHITAESLTVGARWEHTLGRAGVSVNATLVDGRAISHTDVRGTLNCITHVPPDSLGLIHPADREYVHQEHSSFLLSWLNALPQPIINRPTPWGLSGRWRHVSEWIYLAAKAGLPVPYYRLSGRDLGDPTSGTTRAVSPGTPVTTLIVLGDAVLGAPAPPDIQAGCRRLTDLADTALLGVEFVAGPDGGWLFVGATAQPDLRLGGEALLNMLARALGLHKEAGG